uniref:hypothetical protein n=1 Tax=Marinobacterium profundum TaxID=1714300 RepID=UPI001C1F92DE
LIDDPFRRDVHVIFRRRRAVIIIRAGVWFRSGPFDDGDTEFKSGGFLLAEPEFMLPLRPSFDFFCGNRARPDYSVGGQQNFLKRIDGHRCAGSTAQYNLHSTAQNRELGAALVHIKVIFGRPRFGPPAALGGIQGIQALSGPAQQAAHENVPDFNMAAPTIGGLKCDQCPAIGSGTDMGAVPYRCIGCHPAVIKKDVAAIDVKRGDDIGWPATVPESWRCVFVVQNVATLRRKF